MSNARRRSRRLRRSCRALDPWARWPASPLTDRAPASPAHHIRARSGADLANAALLVDETVCADAVAAEVDRDVRLAALRIAARRRCRELHRGVDAGFARRAADAEVRTGIDELVQLDPRAAVRAVGRVDVQLLLHVSVGQVVDDVLVADPHVLRHTAAPLRLVERGARR